MKRIIYPTADGIAVIIPADTSLPIAYIAAKDVPAGVPFRLVDVADIPADRTDRAAWTADFSSPDGHGADFGAGSDNAVVARDGDTLFIRNEQTGELSTLNHPTA
jgi:hypothetical protein